MSPLTRLVTKYNLYPASPISDRMARIRSGPISAAFLPRFAQCADAWGFSHKSGVVAKQRAPNSVSVEPYCPRGRHPHAPTCFPGRFQGPTSSLRCKYPGVSTVKTEVTRYVTRFRFPAGSRSSIHHHCGQSAKQGKGLTAIVAVFGYINNSLDIGLSFRKPLHFTTKFGHCSFKAPAVALGLLQKRLNISC